MDEIKKKIDKKIKLIELTFQTQDLRIFLLG